MSPPVRFYSWAGGIKDAEKGAARGDCIGGFLAASLVAMGLFVGSANR
jgi:hypothetical protein